MHVGREQPLPQVLLVFRCLLSEKEKGESLGEGLCPPTQTFLGVRHAFLPHERLLSGKKRRLITADFQIWEVPLWTFRA